MGTKNLVRLLIAYQVLDATFTYWGVRCLGHGIDIEGNPLMKYCMGAIGPLAALVIIKLVAIFILKDLIKLKDFSVGIKILIGILSAIYTFVVGTWVYMFIINLWSMKCG